MSTAKPTQPPQLDVGAGVKLINALAAKLGLPGINPTNPGRWKRWVGSEPPDFDGVDKGGLRDSVVANAVYLDSVKLNVDQNSAVIESHTEHLTVVDNRLDALEATRLPFPGSS